MSDDSQNKPSEQENTHQSFTSFNPNSGIVKFKLF